MGLKRHSDAFAARVGYSHYRSVLQDFDPMHPTEEEILGSALVDRLI